MIHRQQRYLLLFSLCLLMPTAVAAGPMIERSSASGIWSVTLRAEQAPSINQIGRWSLQIRDAEGAPANPQDVQIGSAMPDHQHGMLTTPAVTKLPDGRYQIDGLRFHMHGWWQLWLRIEDGVQIDHVTFDLRL